MNFMQWLNSLDELLFELMSWLVFFPITLWRVVSRPLAMMRYAEEQLAKPDEEQYAATVTPPLFLVLALLIGQALDMTLYGTSVIVKSRHGLAALVTDNTSLLLLRLILFGTFPVVMASIMVRRRGAIFEREALKPPFYAQCFAVAPLALGLSIGTCLTPQPALALKLLGGAIICGTLAAYVVTQARWFSIESGRALWRGALDALLGVAGAFGLAGGLAFLVVL